MDCLFVYEGFFLGKGREEGGELGFFVGKLSA